MSFTVCINSTKLQYKHPILNTYCSRVPILCVSYNIDGKQVVMQSNIKPLLFNHKPLHANQCLSEDNLKLEGEFAKEFHDTIDQLGKAIDSKTECIKNASIGVLLSVIINNIFGVIGSSMAGGLTNYINQQLENICPPQSHVYLIGLSEQEYEQYELVTPHPPSFIIE